MENKKIALTKTFEDERIRRKKPVIKSSQVLIIKI